MADPRRNIELKAADPDPERSTAVCRALGAVDSGVISQRDTYFQVPYGRLKLREQTPGETELISYERADLPAQRPSHYRIVRTEDGEGLRAALTDALGVTVVVEKQRHLYLWHQVRIHLDAVEGLGYFIELEAVADPRSDLTHEHQLVEQLRHDLAITDDRLCADGYATQLQQKAQALQR